MLLDARHYFSKSHSASHERTDDSQKPSRKPSRKSNAPSRNVLLSMMKQTIKLIGLPILIAGLGLILASRVTAQTFTTLHGFTELNLNSSLTAWTNNDGANPQASLVLSGQTLYGTSAYGGNSGSGSVFAINTDRSEERGV